MKSRLIYLCLVLVIGLVSAYDNLCTWTYRDSIGDLEQNLVGLWLIEKGGVPLFVIAKAVTTLFCVIVCIRLVYTRWRVAIAAVCIFQVALFMYLNFAGGPSQDPNDPAAYKYLFKGV